MGCLFFAAAFCLGNLWYAPRRPPRLLEKHAVALDLLVHQIPSFDAALVVHSRVREPAFKRVAIDYDGGASEEGRLLSEEGSAWWSTGREYYAQVDAKAPCAEERNVGTGRGSRRYSCALEHSDSHDAQLLLEFVYKMWNPSHPDTAADLVLKGGTQLSSMRWGDGRADPVDCDLELLMNISLGAASATQVADAILNATHAFFVRLVEENWIVKPWPCKRFNIFKLRRPGSVTNKLQLFFMYRTPNSPVYVQPVPYKLTLLKGLYPLSACRYGSLGSLPCARDSFGHLLVEALAVAADGYADMRPIAKNCVVMPPWGCGGDTVGLCRDIVVRVRALHRAGFASFIDLLPSWLASNFSSCHVPNGSGLNDLAAVYDSLRVTHKEFWYNVAVRLCSTQDPRVKFIDELWGKPRSECTSLREELPHMGVCSRGVPVGNTGHLTNVEKKHLVANRNLSRYAFLDSLEASQALPYRR